MKRSIAEIGYIAGLLERRGSMRVLDRSDRGVEFCFRNKEAAEHVNSIVKGKLLRKQCGDQRNHILVYVSTNIAIGWFMTCYSLVSPPTKDRIEHAIRSWRSRQFHGVKNRPAECHPDRPFHAKGKCQMCYARMRRGTLYVNVKVGGLGKWEQK